MRPRKLIWQIFPANLLTILLAVVLVSWYGAATLHDFYLDHARKDLQSRAALLAPNVINFIATENNEGLRRYCIQMGRDSGTRITVIDARGKVLADSSEDPAKMDNHRYRPEIEDAFSGRVGYANRYSKTMRETLLYVATPLPVVAEGQEAEAIDHVLRTSISVASLESTFASIKLRSLVAALLVMTFAGVITWVITSNLSKALEQMTRSAAQFAKGDFSEKLLPLERRTASAEIVTLSSSMDRMAELLDEKIQTIVTHRNQLETVFSSMIEAVIAIDNDERVISINDAAAELFGVDRSTSPGKLVQQIVRNTKLQQQIHQVQTSQEAIEDELHIQDIDRERFLQSNIVSLASGVGEHVGVLVVLNDVTHLRRLEEIRRDFVANVSHELRTPITSIQGYVETLLDGAIDDREDALKFLEIVLRQSQRLTTIIDDLLSLSRIEEESREGSIYRDLQPLQPVIEAALQICEVKAEQQKVTLRYECPPNLLALMNATLFEQALVNLVVNGITYSCEGTEIVVTAEEKGGASGKTLRISVADSGCGIDKKHLPRLFERFYRSDKARSRSLGGTGLGLAIVKHIAQAHQGNVEVKSVVGKGSVFTLVLSQEEG